MDPNVDPCQARFVVFRGNSPAWFYTYKTAADFAAEWSIPASKIHPTR